MQNEDAIAILKAKISANALRRIRDAADEISRPKISHTQYLGDRTVQQLGQEPIENAVILNNSANAIGDALMPLAKGQPLQRFDSVNQDDGVGTAKRALLDYAANRDGSSIIRLRTGEQEPANDPLRGTPRGRDPLPKDYPPPFGCVPLFPAKQCIWIPSATPPSGYQSHGSAVINQDGLELFLHCKNGVVPPDNLGCDFLNKKWRCLGTGGCVVDPTGIYNSEAECLAICNPLGTWVLHYSVYGGAQQYNVTFTGRLHDSHSIGVRPSLDVQPTCQTIYGISTANVVVNQNGQLVDGEYNLNCNNDTGILTFVSFTPF